MAAIPSCRSTRKTVFIAKLVILKIRHKILFGSVQRVGAGQTTQICEAILQNVKTDHCSPVVQIKSLSALILLSIVLLSTACQFKQGPSKPITSSETTAHPDINAGYFLAARQAAYLNDVTASAEFFLKTLEQDNQNPELLKHSFIAQYRNGNVDLAALLASQLESTSISAPYATEPAIAQSIKATDWEAVVVLCDQLAEDITAAPLAGVIKSWALVATGRGDSGLEQLYKTKELALTDKDVAATHIQIQIALMAEYLGYHEEAVTVAMELTELPRLTPKTLLQTFGILSRNKRDVTAYKLLNNLPYSFDRNSILPERMLPPKSETAFIADGIIDYAIAFLEPNYAKLVPARLQLALYLDSKNQAAQFFLAQAWANANQFDQAIEMLSYIDDASLWAMPSQLLLNDIDAQLGNEDIAIKRFHSYVTRHEDNAHLHKELGDLYRRYQKYEKARDSYLKAKSYGLNAANLNRNLAIAHERLNEDSQAEIAFTKALEQNPNDPFTLNYLGYWWAESDRKLDQAIQLIERAVLLRPKNGFFVDSLGWVHFKLGNYAFAVEFLEKATILEPEDALIISHLGDAYWRASRYTEARFKWKHAVKLTRDNDLRTELQTKLKYGLSPKRL